MSELLGTINSRLAEAGRITFAEFMELALYAPGGYYRRAATRIGPEGDFYTSPTVHPAFGVLLGGFLADYWLGQIAPEPLEVLELGCGRGTLATDIRLAWRDGAPKLLEAVRYTVSDLKNPAIPDTALPDTILPDNQNPLPFRPADTGIPSGFSGVLLANELLDALPVHRVRKEAGKLREIYLSGSPLAETQGPLSSDRVEELTASWADRMAEGATAEVPVAMLDWLGRLADDLMDGIVLLIDYG
ncbi:MAG: SAM-dependent methyltransferase, partial [Candidatus Sericytochromatia bacterium]|nr:SAM-dependent methyltransferase [Candidatus Tanganyikabacteria bacterium]